MLRSREDILYADNVKVKYREGELFAGGKYTNQSRGGTGVRGWADRKENIVDQDLVVFVQFGINHVSSYPPAALLPVR